MEPSLSPILITLGLVFAIHAILVESISDLNSTPPPPPPQHASPRRREGTLTRPPPPPPPRRLHNRTSHRRKKHPPPPPPPPPRHENKLNTGKKIGLLFAGFASILQIGVVGFLVFKRRQLLTIKDRYENCST